MLLFCVMKVQEVYDEGNITAVWNGSVIYLNTVFSRDDVSWTSFSLI